MSNKHCPTNEQTAAVIREGLSCDPLGYENTRVGWAEHTQHVMAPFALVWVEQKKNTKQCKLILQ